MIVVISGSRSIKSLSPEAKSRIDKIISLGATILVGDASGVDTLVQHYLKTKGYKDVLVYHAYKTPRNNLGYRTVGGFSSYTHRDKAMCAGADYGLAIWDGSSRGTAANIERVKTRVVCS